MIRSNPRLAWISTAAMVETLDCCRGTLCRLKGAGYFREGEHWRKLNPTSHKGKLLWHRDRVLLKMFGG